MGVFPAIKLPQQTLVCLKARYFRAAHKPAGMGAVRRRRVRVGKGDLTAA